MRTDRPDAVINRVYEFYTTFFNLGVLEWDSNDDQH